MGLKKINIKDWRDLAPLEGFARVMKVYDGDTFWLALSPTDPENISLINPITAETQSQLRLVNVRLAKVNAPELKGPEAVQGKASRDYVKSLIEDKIVRFRFGNFGLYNGESLDCYHRQIGLISVPVMIGGSANQSQTWIDLSDHLLESGYAVPFQPKN